MTKSISLLFVVLPVSLLFISALANGEPTTQNIFISLKGNYTGMHAKCGPDDLEIIQAYALDAINTLMVVHSDRFGDVFFDSIETERESFVFEAAHDDDPAGRALSSTQTTTKDERNLVHTTRSQAGRLVGDSNEDEDTGKVEQRALWSFKDLNMWFKIVYTGLLRGMCRYCNQDSSLFDEGNSRGLRGSTSDKNNNASFEMLLIEAEMTKILGFKVSSHILDDDMTACLSQLTALCGIPSP